MRSLPLVGLAAFGALVVVPAAAHHSLSVYDRSQKKLAVGTVKQFEWSNPHSFVHVIVTGADGTMQAWSFEGAGVNTLSKAGWSKSILQPGDKISVRYSPRKDGKVGGGLFQSIVTADGKTWTQPFGAPPSAAEKAKAQ